VAGAIRAPRPDQASSGTLCPVAADPPALPDTSACWAPSTALYFQPDGVVKACCATGFEVGRVGAGPERRTIREVWEGALLRKQREALAAGEFGLGCQDCWVATSDDRPSTMAAEFDRFAADATTQWPVYMDFALSNRCNLQCVMCNGELSSAIRQHREDRPPLGVAYDEQFFDELRAFLPHLRFAIFKGGEPFLSDETARVWDLLRELNPACHVSVTTNGTIWNERVEAHVRDLRMHVNLSVDGLSAATLEPIRVGTRADHLWRNIDRFEELTDELGTGLTLNFCLVPHNVHELGPFLVECDRRGVDATVIVVNQPAEHSVLDLPPDRFEAMMEVFEQIDGDMRSALTRALPAWDEVLTLLRPAATRVHLDTSATVTPEDRRWLADELADLGREKGADPLGIIVHRGTLWELIAEPAWSTVLKPRTWVGQRPQELPHLLHEATGAPVSVDVEQQLDGGFRTTVDLGGAHPELGSGVVAHVRPPRPGRRSPQLLAIVRSDPPAGANAASHWDPDPYSSA